MGEIAAVSVSVTLGLLTLLGLMVRYALLPYLKENLIEPVQQTNRQVSVNHHSSESPTVLDRLDDVRQEVRLLSYMFDGHLDRHQAEVDAIWNELKARRTTTKETRP